MSLVSGSCSLLFWFNTLLLVFPHSTLPRDPSGFMLKHSHHGAFVLYLCSRTGSVLCASTSPPACATQAAVCLWGGLIVCIYAHAVFVETWKSSCQHFRRHPGCLQLSRGFTSRLIICSCEKGMDFIFHSRIMLTFLLALLILHP